MPGLITMAIAIEMILAPWQAINDGVMGGISAGRIVESETGLRFEGELSLENNGGFASVRRVVDADLSETGGVRLKLRGDGRNYQFRLRQDNRFDGIAWRAQFSTSGEWEIVELDFSRFQPVFRGRPVPEAGPVLPSRIRQLGFMLADGQPGPFALELSSIEFIEVGDGSGQQELD